MSIQLLVCRSCVRDNPQSDPCFLNENVFRATYQKKVKAGIFKSICELRVVDCLTCCNNPNAVMLVREDGEMLLGDISSQKDVDEVMKLVEILNNPCHALGPSEALEDKLVYVRPKQEWREGLDAVPGDKRDLK